MRAAPALLDVIGQTSEGVDVTVADRIVQSVRAGNFLGEAAAAGGIHKGTLSRYMTDGARVLRALQTGTSPDAFTDSELEYADFADRLWQAEAQAEVELVATGAKLARGGAVRKTTTVRKDPNGRVLETLEKEEVAAPDGAMLRWLLAHRNHGRWGRETLEVSGPGGGPIEVSTADRRATIAAKLAVIGERMADGDADWQAMLDVPVPDQVPLLPGTPQSELEAALGQIVAIATDTAPVSDD